MPETSRARWYLQRALRMDAREVLLRYVDHLRKIRLARSGVAIAAQGARESEGGFTGTYEVHLDDPTLSDAVASLHRLADDMLDGRLQVFDQERSDLNRSFDWFYDPKSGLRAPSMDPFYAVDHRSWPGSAKHVWEPSRHQHLCILAAAAASTSDERYVSLISDQLESWWKANPPYRGFNWTSGIELGIRLISWVWTRRLLDPFDSARSIFDDNVLFASQLYAHQTWLSQLPSHGSSFNNHAVAESAGLFMAACAFPMFAETPRWLETARERLLEQMDKQVSNDGLHRELSPAYHAFVVELFLLAALEGENADYSLGQGFWVGLRGMIDALASLCDSAGNPPRQNDSDDAVALKVDGEEFHRVASLLETGASLFGARDWWPQIDANSLRSICLTSLAEAPPLKSREGDERGDYFPESGIAILRQHSESSGSELWCRCDAGPLGYLATAAHGHADALAIEVRYDGFELLVDPGTYCYQYEPKWREYFRSTAAHNTLEVLGRLQARSDGAFLWKAMGSANTLELIESGADLTRWTGCFKFKGFGMGPRHIRKVTIGEDLVEVTDMIDFDSEVALRFHLGPEVSCSLDRNEAHLRWSQRGRERRATIELPETLQWVAVVGRKEPPLGWYSPGFGVKIPTVTLEGVGTMISNRPVTTRMMISEVYGGGLPMEIS